MKSKTKPLSTRPLSNMLRGRNRVRRVDRTGRSFSDFFLGPRIATSPQIPLHNWGVPLGTVVPCVRGIRHTSPHIPLFPAQAAGMAFEKS